MVRGEYSRSDFSVVTKKRSHPLARLMGRCYIGSSSKISTAHFPSLLDRNGRPSVSAFAAARSSASTIV